MARDRKYTVKVRRRRTGKTNYNKRISYIKSYKPRLVVRRSNNNIQCQIIEAKEKGDKVLYSSSSHQLKKIGWNAHTGNIPSAYLTGLLLGKKSKAKIKEAIIDFGLQPSIKGSRLYALIKGAIDGGLNINCSDKLFPRDDIIKGRNISEYLKSFTEDKKTNQFLNYKKANLDPEKFVKHFEDIKKKIDNLK